MKGFGNVAILLKLAAVAPRSGMTDTESSSPELSPPLIHLGPLLVPPLVPQQCRQGASPTDF